MEYYFSTTLKGSFEEAVSKVTGALDSEGFGVITRIVMHEKLKEKLGVDFKKYVILGACNPPLAYNALLAEDKIGTMLPCNVLVIDQGHDMIEVAAVNPVASMSAITNPSLGPVAADVTGRLQRVIEKIS
jgi:uncharacterized protein (DUF302 family)